MRNLRDVCYLLVLGAILVTNYDPAQAGEKPAPKLASTLPVPLSAEEAGANAGSTIVLPAGTRVLMGLRSPLHTTSAGQGSGVYLETIFPVVSNDRVVIPVHTRVLGTVEAARRPGRLQRNAQFRFHFTSMVFSNGYTVPIDGVVQSIPGSSLVRVHGSEGTLQPVDQAEKALVPVAVLTVAGGLLGSVRNVGARTYHGAALGAGLGLANVILTRGDEISLSEGTQIEMVLSRQVNLDLTRQPAETVSAEDDAPAMTSPTAFDAHKTREDDKPRSLRKASEPAKVSPARILRDVFLGTR